METNLQGDCTPQQVADVIRIGLPLMERSRNTGQLICKAYDKHVRTATGVGYNRGWLLIAQAWLEANDPKALVDLSKREPAAMANAKRVQAELQKQADEARKNAKTEAEHKEADRLQTLAQFAAYRPDRDLVGPAVKELRELNISWGEISVRLNTPESTCRKGFDYNSEKKARGLRTGHGGRFAYGEKALYEDNRKKEGAHIPIGYKMRPKPEDLLNFVPKEKPVKQPKAVAKKSA